MTIRDVAVKAGVSTATVSRVLSGTVRVRENTRARVLKAVRSLHFQPNRLAQGLRAGQRKVICVILPDLQNPFFTSLVHGIEAALYEAGYILLLGHSDGLAEREQKHLSILRGEGAAGLIIIPSNAPGANYHDLAAGNVPTVAVDRLPNGLDTDLVTTNNRDAMREAVAHLISHGYKDIAFINGPQGLNVTDERRLGYQDALLAAGIPQQESLIIHSDFRHAGGMSATTRLLGLRNPPRAVVVANNLMSLGALQVIQERGLRIPDEIAIVSFDDMPWATSLSPALTAMAQPAEELGRTSARLLLEKLENPRRPPREIILPARLMVRASCGQHPGGTNSNRSSLEQRP